MDIVFGDCVGLGGFRYALLLVDVATWYCWIYGMMEVNSSDITGALEEFQVDAGGLPKRIHTDFYRKLMGDKALTWIVKDKSSVIDAPAGCQSSNGIAELAW